MNALNLLPLELWCEIAKFSPELLHSLCLAVPTLGRYSLLSDTQRWIQGLLPVIDYYDQGHLRPSSHTWYFGGKIHRANDKPARLLYLRENGNILSERFYQNNMLHRDDDRPAKLTYWLNGSLASQEWYQDGTLKRADKAHPSKVCYRRNGSIDRKYWHRPDSDDFFEVVYSERMFFFGVVYSGKNIPLVSWDKFEFDYSEGSMRQTFAIYHQFFSFFFDDYQSFVVNCEL